jgi:hypothetical protein
MKLYIFRSETKNDLRAFCGDLKGSRLQDRFRPWQAIGVVRPDRPPPHALPGAEIERSIATQGFQLWRLKAT